MIKSLITAFRTLTILPLPGKETKHFSRSIPFFPLIGIFLGSLVYGLYFLAQFVNFDYPLVLSVIGISLITIMTGGLHIDGLGDVTDGFGSGGNKQRILEIFKDSRMGAFGTCAIVFDILLKTFCWGELFHAGEIYFIILSLIFSRSSQGLYVVFLPAATESSIIAPFNKSSLMLKTGTFFTFTISIIFGVYTVGLIPSILCALSVIFMATFFGIYCLKKINGITGDCVGAVNELTELVVLLTSIVLVRV